MGDVVPFGRKPARSGQRRTRPLAPGGPPASRSRTGSPDIARLPDLDIPVQDPALSSRRPASSGREPLWRNVTGAVLADERRRQRRTLAQVATRAGMSVQYLSELERGRKEASSEMLAAACGALGLSLADFATRCAGLLDTAAGRPGGPTLLAA